MVKNFFNFLNYYFCFKQMINRVFIYAGNVLITDRETAKIGNFNSMDYSNILAPEKRYDTKSIVYSFGILLWEIAEEKYPQKGNEAFSKNSLLPKEYREITQKGNI
jgi:hypothetical protein